MNETGILIGIAIFILVLLPVLVIRDIRQRRKIRKILDACRSQGSAGREHAEAEPDSGGNPHGKTKGWGMNNSPFRSRKSGLRWEGGNIKASGATRGDSRKGSPRP